MWIRTRKHVRRGEKRTCYCEFEGYLWSCRHHHADQWALRQHVQGSKGTVQLPWGCMSLRHATEIVTSAQDCAAQAAQLRKDIADATHGQ